MKYYIAIMGLIMLSACTKTISVKTPNTPSKIVLNGRSFTGDTIKVKVSKSVDIKEYRTNTSLDITNATAKIYVNGALAGDMTYDAENNLYTSNVVAEKDKEYMIEVSAPSLETVTAKSKVPEQVDIINLKRIQNVKTSTDGVQLDEITISFKDPATTGDHYVVSIIGPYSMFVPGPGDTVYSYSNCVYTSDPSVETIYNTSLETNTCFPNERIFFNDILYNGKEKEIKLQVSNGFLRPYKDQTTGETIYPEITLFHITDEYFKYLKSYQYAQDNEGNPFAEPTNAYTNVKNGYGMFSISGHDSKEIK
jgi:hypothetical protein